jgi:hypothetical protein
MKPVYVTGPHRAAGEWQVLNNVRRAEAVALEVWRMGCLHFPVQERRFFWRRGGGWAMV